MKKFDRIIQKLKEKKINLAAPARVNFNLESGRKLYYNVKKFDWCVKFSDVRKILKEEFKLK